MSFGGYAFEQINVSTAGATIGIPHVRAGDEASLLVRQPGDEECHLLLLEEVYQMESVFPRNIYLGTHDWGKCSCLRAKPAHHPSVLLPVCAARFLTVAMYEKINV